MSLIAWCLSILVEAWRSPLKHTFVLENGSLYVNRRLCTRTTTVVDHCRWLQAIGYFVHMTPRLAVWRRNEIQSWWSPWGPRQGFSVSANKRWCYLVVIGRRMGSDSVLGSALSSSSTGVALSSGGRCLGFKWARHFQLEPREILRCWRLILCPQVFVSCAPATLTWDRYLNHCT